MRNAKRTIRRYIGGSRRWKLLMAAIAAAGLVLGALSLVLGRQPEPVPVPFNPDLAENGDYCTFEAVGISPWLYRETTKNGTYSHTDTWYLAQDTEGRAVIVRLPMEEQTQIFSQQLYFAGGDLMGNTPKPHMLKGIARSMRESGDLRRQIAGALEIDPGEEFEALLGSTYLAVGESPKHTGSGKLYGYALLAGMALVCVFMAKLGVVSGAGISLRQLKKHGRLEEAARQLAAGHPEDPVVTGDGYLFLKNKGIALCPEMVTEATCSGSTVWVKSRLEPQPTMLTFYDIGQARRFMEFIPLMCVRDDEVMVKTSTPEKYGDENDY